MSHSSQLANTVGGYSGRAPGTQADTPGEAPNHDRIPTASHASVLLFDELPPRKRVVFPARVSMIGLYVRQPAGALAAVSDDSDRRRRPDSLDHVDWNG
jgi:hypothetical protein